MLEIAYNSGNMKALPDIDLAKMFRETRESLGYTQAEMASRLGATREVYQKWEYGTRVPNGQAVAKIFTLRESMKPRS